MFQSKIDPIADIETIETELMLADMDSLEKRVVSLEKEGKQGDKEAREMADLMNRALVLLREGKPARLVERTPDEEKMFRGLGLLSSKPVLYVCNVEEASADKGNEFSAAGVCARQGGGCRRRRRFGEDRKRDRHPAGGRPEGLSRCRWP